MMKLMKITTGSKIEELLTRGVEEVIDKKHLEKRLFSGEKLRIKFGVDPTTPDIHLGHAVILRKLREFQKLGHQVVFIIGDFTAKIGDPTGKLNVRRALSEKEIKRNIKTYKKQVGKILDIRKTEVVYNSQHFSKMSFAELYRILHFFTVNQILERDIFQERREKQKPIWMHEFFYPIFQAYDSVIVNADIEIGGRDQLFNMLAGRSLQPYYNQDGQDIITVKLLIGLDGKKKMSKSLGNYVGIAEPAQEQYGKIMSLPDDLLIHYFELVTDVPLKDIAQMKGALNLRQVNPKELKAKLAREVVSIYHSKQAALAAEKEFNRVFQEKKLPQKMPSFLLSPGNYQILDLLVKIKLAGSRSEAQRLVTQSAVKINEKVCNDWRAVVKISKNTVIQAGKRRFVKII